MTTITIELTAQEVSALKARTGKRTPTAALRAWVGKADESRSAAEIRAALQNSSKEESQGKGRRFKAGRDAIKWLGS